MTLSDVSFGGSVPLSGDKTGGSIKQEGWGKMMENQEVRVVYTAIQFSICLFVLLSRLTAMLG